MAWQNSMKSWFADLQQIGRISAGWDPFQLLLKLAQHVGVQDVLDRLHVCQGQRICFTLKTGVKEVRMSIGPMQSIMDYATMFHEFGHAVLYDILSQQDERLFLYLTPWADEAFAVLFESLAMNQMFQGEPLQQYRDISLLQYQYTARSALFELELWQNPQEARTLYAQHMGRLGVSVEQPKLWSLNSFYSIDSMMVAGYPLGHILAQQLCDGMAKRTTVDVKHLLKSIAHAAGRGVASLQSCVRQVTDPACECPGQVPGMV